MRKKSRIRERETLAFDMMDYAYIPFNSNMIMIQNLKMK